MILTRITRLDRNAHRLSEILSILGRYGLADWFGNLPYDWIQKRLVAFDGQRLGGLTKEARVRLALIELGTTFIKLGQMLSTREHLVGSALASELKQLQDKTPPDPPEVVRQTVAAELGKPPEEAFQEFEAAAFASASIAQVHRARLPDGRRVIVKVQHAGIEGKVNCDLDLMMGLAEVLEKHVPQLRSYRPVATTRELRRVLLRELDFSSERRNLETITRNFAEAKTVHFPTVYPELCSRRVLTMELLEGILVTNYEELHASGIDLNEVALRAADMYLEMIFRDGFYHADPHAGNFILLPGGVVGVLDFGLVGHLDEQLRDHVDTLLLAVGPRRFRALDEVVLEPRQEANRRGSTSAAKRGQRLSHGTRRAIHRGPGHLGSHRANDGHHAAIRASDAPFRINATKNCGDAGGDGPAARPEFLAGGSARTPPGQRRPHLCGPATLAAKVGTIVPGLGAAGEGPAGKSDRRIVRPSRWDL